MGDHPIFKLPSLGTMEIKIFFKLLFFSSPIFIFQFGLNICYLYNWHDQNVTDIKLLWVFSISIYFVPDFFQSPLLTISQSSISCYFGHVDRLLLLNKSLESTCLYTTWQYCKNLNYSFLSKSISLTFWITSLISGNKFINFIYVDRSRPLVAGPHKWYLLCNSWNCMIALKL